MKIDWGGYAYFIDICLIELILLINIVCCLIKNVNIVLLIFLIYWSWSNWIWSKYKIVDKYKKLDLDDNVDDHDYEYIAFNWVKLSYGKLDIYPDDFIIINLTIK